MKSRGFLERGSIVMVWGIWHVVIEVVLEEDGRVLLNCVCDHANNRFTFGVNEVDVLIDKRGLLAINYGNLRDDLQKAVNERPIPYDVICEVLCGSQDDHFEDYWPEVRSK
jgi:hypothetical protein